MGTYDDPAWRLISTLFSSWGRVLGVSCGTAAAAGTAVGRVWRRSGPAPALATFPVQGRSCGLRPFAGGGWLVRCGAATHAKRSVSACNRRPPSSTSASTSGLSSPVLPRRLWRVVGWVGFLSDVIGGVRSGPGVARTMLLFHTISARPPKQPRMVRTFLKVHTLPRLAYALLCRGY